MGERTFTQRINEQAMIREDRVLRAVWTTGVGSR